MPINIIKNYVIINIILNFVNEVSDENYRFCGLLVPTYKTILLINGF